MDSVFQDKVVLITGAASGFGALLAKTLGERGCKLVLGDLNLDGLQVVAQSLTDLNIDVAFAHCNVTREEDCKLLVDLAVERFGGLDMACNNAGVATALRPLIEMTEKDFDLNFAVNTKGVFFGMKYQIQQMLTQGHGIVLNVASMAGLVAAPKLAPYGAAKHAVVGLTKTAAVEYGKKNIRCNAICPYFSPTPLIANMSYDAPNSPFAQASPMKRLADPQEVVNTMICLLSPENSYLNGQALAVDGGLLAV